MEKRKILVTGGCGFIGSNLVNGLLDAGHNVTVLDFGGRPLMINANGNPLRYAEFGLPIHADVIDGFAGPAIGGAGVDFRGAGIST